jgi:hypothetical protein
MPKPANSETRYNQADDRNESSPKKVSRAIDPRRLGSSVPKSVSPIPKKEYAWEQQDWTDKDPDETHLLAGS